MLHKSTRKKLREHNWLYLADRDPNPSDTLRRLTNRCIEAINDLSLLASRLPVEKQDAIFSKTAIENLIRSIFRGSYKYNEKRDEGFEGRIAQLASLLAQLGTQECIDLYRSKVEPNDILNEPIISHLTRTQEICDEIALKIYLPYIRSQSKKGLDYLFNWDRVYDIANTSYSDLKRDDFKSFVNFVSNSWPVPDTIEYINNMGNKKKFRFLGDPPGILQGYLEIVREDMCVKVVIQDEDRDDIVITLPIKRVGNETHVFARKNSAKELEKYYGLDQ